MNIILVKPTEQLKEKALDYRREHFDHNEMIINGSALFDKTESYEEWMDMARRNANPQTVSPDWVLADVFFAMNSAQNEIVGMIDLRYELNDFLADFGNTGYSVRPSMRRKGYATGMLKQLLVIAKNAGMTRLQLSAERGNEASIKTIQRGGGRYQRSFEHDGKWADVYKIDL